jgi:predicted O-methyltransferase YrrM
MSQLQAIYLPNTWSNQLSKPDDLVFLIKMTSPIVASSEVQSLLKDLHAQSAAQENSFQATLWYLSRTLRYSVFGTAWTPSDDKFALSQFVALEPEKCDFVYLLARSIGALNIVEAGTSFGVSTIYLALAVGQNVAEQQKSDAPVTGKVIATEKEKSKAARAREHWSKAGTEVEPWIELREGDLLETLKVEEGMPKDIDMLLLDSVFLI